MKFKEKSVIIHRSEKGFGFRVGGENPVFVQYVHADQAAWKAGVRQHDRIIKVNGTLVKSYNHQRVVQMIRNCTPFVNLTLHSPETPPIDVVTSRSQSPDPNNVGDRAPLLIGNDINDISNTSNLVSSGSVVHPLQRLHHPHSVSNNLNWLLDIGDDLFQDSQQGQSSSTQQSQSQMQQHPQISFDSISRTNTATTTTHLHHLLEPPQPPPPPAPPVGISKLVVSGPNPLPTSHSQQIISSGGKPKLRHNKSQASARDNPYYYYKTVPERGPEVTSCNSATVLNQDNHHQSSSSKLTTGLSINRSRSSSKMSTRSMSGKYKSKNLRSRLVEDLKSLTITNNSQTTPSSLSTSPSSSDLSDCDDQDSNRLDNISMNTSNSSAGAINLSMTSKTDSSGFTISNQPTKPKHTTRRLEIIRELVDTEKTHTERLKHLNDLLYKPIKAEGLVPAEQLKMVFSCHKTLFKVHRQIYKILSAAQRNVSECHREPLVGKALVEIFEGELGYRLEKAASTFCACQATNTELLNRFTRKDTKVGEFLAQVANQQMLGRLGIKDLLASCFQRLTKYPLLLENLLKATPTTGATQVGHVAGTGIHSKSLSEGHIGPILASTFVPHNDSTTSDGMTNDGFVNTEPLTTPDQQAAEATTTTSVTSSGLDNNNTNDDSNNSNVTANTLEEDYAFERLCISRALDQSRQILIKVNESVKRAISHNKLRDIWKKTDKNPAFDAIDISTQQLLHDGPLTLRLAKRSYDVYVLLLTHYLVILTREGQDKYKLKHFTADGKPATQSKPAPHGKPVPNVKATQFSPVFNIDEHLATRDTATDENGFYLLCKRRDEHARIYEFASQSPADRAKWKEKIHMAQLYNFAAVPDDDNTLTRYRELITLAISSNTPNNIEHSPTNNNIVATTTAATTITTTTSTTTSTTGQSSNSTTTTVCPTIASTL